MYPLGVNLRRSCCLLVFLASFSSSAWSQRRGATPAQQQFESILHNAFELHKQDQYAEAIPLLESAYKIRPGDYFVNLLLGIDLLRTGKSLRAVLFLKAAAKLRPQEEFPLEYLGEAQAGLGNYSEAARAYLAAQQASPESTQAAITLTDFSLDRFAQLAAELRSSQAGLAAEYRLQALSTSANDAYKLELLLRAAGLDDDSPGIWSEIAFVQCTSGDTVAARESVDRVLKKDPSDLRAWEVQTFIAAKDSDATAVVDHINAIAGRSSFALAQTLRDWPAGLHIPDPSAAKGAAVQFLKCLKGPHCDPNSLSKSASSKSASSNSASSRPQHPSIPAEQLYREQRWEKLAELAVPESNYHALWRGIAFAHIDRCADAIPVLEHSIQDSASAEASFWLSACYSREAAVAAERVQKASGDDVASHIIRGDVLLRLQGNAKAAIQEYQAALSRRTNDASLWARLAESQLGAEQLESAEQSAQAALKFEARCLPAKRVLAKTAMQRRDYPMALAYLRELVAHDPRDVTTRVELGTACAQTGALQEALENLAPALQQGYPDEKGSLHYLLGMVLRKMGKDNEAEQAFQAAREISDRFQQESRQSKHDE